MPKTMTVRATIAAVLAGLSMSAHAIADSPKRVDIPAGDLRQALLQVSEQFGTDLVYSPEQVQGIQTRGAHGQLTTEQAVTKLLEGTPLELRTDPSGAMLITPPSAAKDAPRPSASTREPSKSFWSRLRLAQADTPSASQANTQNPSSFEGDGQGEDGTKGRQPPEKAAVEEIVVTGTNIRGIESPGSAVHRFERADIEQSGIGTTEQFLQSLPQNFGGGNSASTVGGILGGEESNFNYGHGTGVNLRGLGNDSTLVLVNGRRVAPAGVGSFVDISMIPITAVERMEMLADGASAIYGSDAVAGVVNITLRRDFSGAESRARYASVTSGDFDELQLGQAFGSRWGGGSAMLTYEYFDRSQLESQDRAFTRDYTDATWLMPTEDRHSAIGSLEQRFGERVNAFANASFSKRDSQVLYDGGFVETDTHSKVEQYGVTAGASVDMSAGWRAEFAGAYSTNNTFYGVTFPGFANTLDQNSDVYSLDVKADGDLFEATGGRAKLAFGGQYRHEKFDAQNSTYFELDRDAKAVFAELFWPLIGSGNSTALAQRLELSLAGRYEDYSDFGSTFDPKVGIVWAPAAGLSLRGTIGTSFRAPLLSELRPVLFVDVFNFFDPLVGAAVPTLFLQGGTGHLGPEQSTAWTVGMDIEPAAVPEMKLSLTYFDIDFEDRITIPIPFSALGSALSDEARYAIAIERNPDLARVNELFAEPTFFNPDGVLPGDVVAIIDDRTRNIASRTQQGLDFTLSYATALASGQFNAQLSGTYLFSMDEQITPASPVAALVNNPFYPADFKLRGNVGWSSQAWGASAFLNYIDNYKDARTATPSAVSSWTTLDVSLRYKGFTSALLGGTELLFNVLNVFDRAPPFVAGNGLNFDATNASALGRFASFQITHRW
jgi:iron complex outermembrane recepter protein